MVLTEEEFITKYKYVYLLYINFYKIKDIKTLNKFIIVLYNCFIDYCIYYLKLNKYELIIDWPIFIFIDALDLYIMDQSNYIKLISTFKNDRFVLFFSEFYNWKEKHFNFDKIMQEYLKE